MQYSEDTEDSEEEEDEEREANADGKGAAAESDPTLPRAKRARWNIMTRGLAASLDRVKVTDREAVFVLSEAARSLGHDVTSLNINRSSIRRERMKHREEMARTIKQSFDPETPLVVHWDGKLMRELTTKEHVDRLPILVSGKGVTQLLHIAKLPSGTGAAMANAVVDALEEWNITDRIVGMSFDTTASNTGRTNGACVIMQQKLEKNLLAFACRHHVHELILHAAFVDLLGPTSSNEVRLFKRFQAKWYTFDHTAYQTGADHAEVVEFLPNADDFQEWASKKRDLRDDYQELVDLCVIFIGRCPVKGVRFMAPGPMHHARWMAKAIYSLKTWLFRSQFKLTTKEKGLRKVCIFVVTIYAKAWVESTKPAAAPNNDLQLLKALAAYPDKDIKKVTSAKLLNHLWYLSEELVALSFFDTAVPDDVKSSMVAALEKPGSEDRQTRIKLPISAVADAKLSDFVSCKTLTFFTKLGLSREFLASPPSTWHQCEGYSKALSVVSSIKVVNDHTERGVKLIQDYNQVITKDEDQLQFMVQ